MHAAEVAPKGGGNADSPKQPGKNDLLALWVKSGDFEAKIQTLLPRKVHP